MDLLYVIKPDHQELVFKQRPQAISYTNKHTRAIH